MSYTNAQRVIDTLWSSIGGTEAQLYAVLDGARNAGTHSAVLASGCEFECLYRGELEPDLAEAAPYLVKLQKNHPFTNWLVEEGWGESWGIFIQTTASLKDARQHLRKFLMVYDSDTKPLYFRYYDPRVLRVYLPTCNAQELATVFGPVQSYLLENDGPNDLLQFSNAAGALQTQRIPLPVA